MRTHNMSCMTSYTTLPDIIPHTDIHRAVCIAHLWFSILAQAGAAVCRCTHADIHALYTVLSIYIHMCKGEIHTHTLSKQKLWQWQVDQQWDQTILYRLTVHGSGLRTVFQSIARMIYQPTLRHRVRSTERKGWGKKSKISKEHTTLWKSTPTPPFETFQIIRSILILDNYISSNHKVLQFLIMTYSIWLYCTVPSPMWKMIASSASKTNKSLNVVYYWVQFHQPHPGRITARPLQPRHHWNRTCLVMQSRLKGLQKRQMMLQTEVNTFIKVYQSGESY